MLTLVLAIALAAAEPDDSACMLLNGCPVVAAAAGHVNLGELEFAPTDGTGMGTECACAAVTGTRAEVMTFTRASAATCTKADGTLVTCSTDQPRVQYVPSTTNLALLVEGAATNVALRSEAFDNAAWAKINSGSADPVVTANAAVAPDGTTTADSIAYPLLNSANIASQMEQAVTTGSSVVTGSIWLKTAGANTKTLTLWITPPTWDANSAKITVTPTTSWVRYTVTSAGVGTSWYLALGCNTFATVNSSTPCGDFSVLAWGAQVEIGANATSYVPTAGSTVARAAELARLPWPAAVTNTTGCYSFYAYKNNLNPNTGLETPVGGQGNTTGVYIIAGAVQMDVSGHDGANAAARNGVATVVGTNTKFKVDWNTTGTQLGLTVLGTRATATYDGTVAAATINIGSLDGTSRHWGGLVSDVVFNTTVGGCP